MPESTKIDKLLKRLDELSIRQEEFRKEIAEIRNELHRLKWNKTAVNKPKSPPLADVPETKEPVREPAKPLTTKDPILEAMNEVKVTETFRHRANEERKRKEQKHRETIQNSFKLEKFIGENLLLIVGVGITVLGVGIGAKFAIDNNMVNPLTRIVMGYLTGAGLLGVAIYLKEKYESYSAGLLSGSMAIMYIITFMAYSLYGLFPQTVAFGLMVFFTIFTVIAALHYDRQVIALIGLVGAYFVPVLLSDGSGQIQVLFIYMTIINCGILAISVFKYWKKLYYSAFVLTWLIYAGWFFDRYQEAYFNLGFGFALTFFFIFYATFVANRLFQKEKYTAADIISLLLNSFIFYAFGFMMIGKMELEGGYLGLFTLLNAVVHFGVSVLLYLNKSVDRNLFYLVSGMVLVFVTIAVPIQLDGNWVTFMWAGLAVLMFVLGRTQAIKAYERLSYPLIMLSLFSLAHDWSVFANEFYRNTEIKPIFNLNFLTSILVVIAYGIINWVNVDTKYPAPQTKRGHKTLFPRLFLPTILIITLYFSFFIEIAFYWERIISALSSKGLYDATTPYYHLQTIWQMNYTMLFAAALSFVNIFWIKNKKLSLVGIAINLLALFVFLSNGLLELGYLRDIYLQKGGKFSWILIRYLSFALVAGIVYACYKYRKEMYPTAKFHVYFDALFFGTILWVASSELINWMDFAGSKQSYKLGLSILWGVYAVLLIVLGIWKKKKHLRLGAMYLFGVTLVKLFAYDIESMSTIGMVIVLVSLGVLLLIASFLYNKFKDTMAEE